MTETWPGVSTSSTRPEALPTPVARKGGGHMLGGGAHTPLPRLPPEDAQDSSPRSGRQGRQERGLAAAPFWARAPATPAPRLCLGKSLCSPTSRGTRRSRLPLREPCCTGPTSPPPAPTCARPAPRPRHCHVQHPGLLPPLHLSRCSGCRPRSVLRCVSCSDQQIHPRLMQRTQVRGP